MRTRSPDGLNKIKYLNVNISNSFFSEDRKKFRFILFLNVKRKPTRIQDVVAEEQRYLSATDIGISPR
jgi:hypothetical protein